MISQENKEKPVIEGSQDWLPAEQYHPTPTLFIPYGLGSGDLRQVQGEIDLRLRSHPPGLIRWAGVIQPDEVNWKEILAGFEERQFLNRLVEKGYLTNLPDIDNPLEIQLVVIYDAQDRDDVQIKEDLESLAVSIDIEHPHILSLVLLDGSNTKTVAAERYWPRIRLSSSALGGVSVSREEVLRTCEHLLVALATSELSKAISHVVQCRQDADDWLALGASIIRSAVPEMRDHLSAATLEKLLKPLVAATPGTLERDRLYDVADDKADSIQNALFSTAVDAVRDAGWVIKNQDRQILSCDIAADTSLRKMLFGPCWADDLAIPEKMSESRSLFSEMRSWLTHQWLRLKQWFKHTWRLLTYLRLGFLPERELLSNELSEHYITLDLALQERVASITTAEFRTSLDFIANLLDRGFTTKTESSSSLITSTFPHGLPAAIVAAKRMVQHLAQDEDILDRQEQSVRPSPLGGKAYWHTAATVDVNFAYNQSLIHRRFVRSTASPIGVLLYLIPVWPLLTSLLSLIPQWSIARAATISGLALLLIGIIETVRWWLNKARQLLEETQAQTRQSLAERILSLTAKTLKDYRWVVMARMYQVVMFLEDLQLACWEGHHNALVGSQTPPQSIETESLFTLADAKSTASWISKAVECARGEQLTRQEEGGRSDFDSSITHLIGEQILLEQSAQPMSTQAVMSAIEQLGANCADYAFRPEKLGPPTLAESHERLTDGQWWRWLWHSAHPLGDKGAYAFTFITAISDDVLRGKTGKESPHWGQADGKDSWQVVRSIQKYELGCIRGIILKSDAGKEE